MLRCTIILDAVQHIPYIEHRNSPAKADDIIGDYYDH